MSRLLFSLLLLATALSGADLFWDQVHTYRLKKDQTAKITVIKPDLKGEREKRSDLTFRWTLYRNGRLVLLMRYGGFPTQHILEAGYKRDAARLYLRDDYSREDLRSYLLIRFQKFDPKRRIATLDVMVKDPQKRVRMIFENEKKAEGGK